MRLLKTLRDGCPGRYRQVTFRQSNQARFSSPKISLPIIGRSPAQNACAASMAPTELKRDFGNGIYFWGGGWVFNTIHNIQADVPPANIMVVRETLVEFGVY